MISHENAKRAREWLESWESCPEDEEGLFLLEKESWQEYGHGWDESPFTDDLRAGLAVRYPHGDSSAYIPEQYEGFFIGPSKTLGSRDYWFFLIFPDRKVACFYLLGDLFDTEHRPNYGWDVIQCHADIERLAEDMSFCRIEVANSKEKFRPELDRIKVIEFPCGETIYSRGLCGLGI